MNMLDYLPRDSPTIDEVYTVARRRVTDEELVKAAHGLVTDCWKVWNEDPGVWQVFEEFLAFQAGVAAFCLTAPEPVADLRKFTERFILLCQMEARMVRRRTPGLLRHRQNPHSITYEPPQLEDECDE